MTGRTTRIRTRAAGGTGATGRTTRIRTSSAGISGVTGATGRTTRIRTRAVGGTAPTTQAVQPFDLVNLGAGSWTETAGVTVTVPTYTAPALPGGDVEQFTTGSTTETVTVAPHTMFRITAGGLTGLRETNL